MLATSPSAHQKFDVTRIALAVGLILILGIWLLRVSSSGWTRSDWITATVFGLAALSMVQRQVLRQSWTRAGESSALAQAQNAGGVTPILAAAISADALTGLAVREQFLAQLQSALDGASQGGIAIFFVDLDRFKVIVDSLGHASADQLLRAFAGRLERYFRGATRASAIQPTYLAARFGADEFAVALSGISKPEAALAIADGFEQTLHIPFTVDAGQYHLSASIGIAIAFGENDRAEELVRQADLAMYRAKAKGRARSQMFEPGFDLQARNVLQQESELRQSFHDGSLQLFYQPIVSLYTAQAISFEALLRWRHPVRGMVSPGEILPLAEQAGLSFQLGRWVLNESCQQLRRWRDQYPNAAQVSISSNLSGRELMRPTLLDEVKRLLSEHSLEGSALLIELTETTIMEGDAVAVDTLNQLRELGVRLALDDFGRGHSSLGRLQDFPISMLKVDSSFVKEIGGPKQKILDAIMALAHELKIEVTAEGVENHEQLHYLVQCGASRAQGLLFADALSEQEAGELLRDARQWASLGLPVNRVSRMSAR